MDCPLIYHDDGVLGDEEAFVPVIFDDIVICAQFVDRTPSERFLPSDLTRGRKLEMHAQRRKSRCEALRDQIRAPRIAYTVLWILSLFTELPFQQPPTLEHNCIYQTQGLRTFTKL